MKNPGIQKLKYPMWFRIVFFLLTVIIPMVFICISGYQVDNTVFQCTFGVISSTLTLWMLFRSFVMKPWAEKTRSRQATLEHEYEVEIGNADKIKWIWFTNEQKLALYDTITLLLVGGLIVLILSAVINTMMDLKLSISIIVICYIIAYILKFFVISLCKGLGGDSDE